MILAPYPKYSFVDNNGRPLVGGLLFTYVAGTTTKITTYTDSTGGTPNTNPIVLDFRGEANVWLDPTLTYKFVLAPPGDTDPPTKAIWTVDQVSGLGGLTQQIIGQILWPRSAAEITAVVFPTNYGYPWGDLRRYGAAINGTTDDRAAFEAAIAQWNAGGAQIILPAGTCKVSKNGANTYALLFVGDCVLEGHGAFTLKGDGASEYTLVMINNPGSTPVKIDISGVKFDCAMVGYTPASSNSICIRSQSNIDTINIENCHFTRYAGDAIYMGSRVDGDGGFIRDCTATDGGRAAITMFKGERIVVSKFIARDIQLQAFNFQAQNIGDVFRRIDIVDCHVFGGGNYGGAFASTDRCGFFVCGVVGAAATDQCDIRVINCSAFDIGITAPGTVPLAMGIETRDIVTPLVKGFFAKGNRDAGLYSFRTTKAVYVGCTSIGNGKGLWMNFCVDYSDVGNTCVGNTLDRDYNGPSGVTSFVQADGLNFLLARAVLKFSGGAPFLAPGHYNLNVARHGAAPAGDFDLTFDYAAGEANYSVLATFNSHTAAAGGLIQSASPTTAGFRFQTYNAGALSDQQCDILVIGAAKLTTIP